jgi:hypothetical protein
VCSSDLISIAEALAMFDPFPWELKLFYEEMGFGFMHRKKGEINLLLDPTSLVNINLLLGYNKDDVNINRAMQDCDINEQLLFFRTNDLHYLSISRKRIEGKNPVYYHGKMITDSLEKFLIYYNRNDSYVKNKIEEVEELIVNEEVVNQQKKTTSTKNKQKIGGHVVIDPW